MANRSKGFTLIELLIVVAIIAILAAIAVPNFLEAQVRSKVSRTKEDMRALAVAMESYRLDYTDYPPDNNFFSAFGPVVPVPVLPYPDYDYIYPLTTPVAYLTSIPKNIFPALTYQTNAGTAKDFRYDYASTYWLRTQATFNGFHSPHSWTLASTGPDRVASGGVYVAMFGPDTMTKLTAGGFGSKTNTGGLYDPTNGTMSTGDIVRVGP